MDKIIFHCGLYLSGVLISAIAQVMLKKSASKKASVNIFSLIEKLFPKLYSNIENGTNAVFNFVRKNKKILIEYLNPFTMVSYVIFVIATFLTIFSYKVVPLSMAPILGSSEYFFIAALSKIFLKEKLGFKKILGLSIIVVGALVYSFGKPI